MMTGIQQKDDSNQSSNAIGKGKRTMHPHPPSILTLTMACTSLSSDVGGETGDRLATTRSPASSENTESEEDMANCLILLAQGGHITKGATANTSLTRSDLGSNTFKCKTCFRCFPSFQALGGHRTSHKKPKITGTGDTRGRNSDPSLSPAGTELSLRISAPDRVFCDLTTRSLNKPKVHECSICRAEFATGQALGGHMRRHRQALTLNNTKVITAGCTSPCSPGSKGKNVLELDLNLPAPEDREYPLYCFQAKGQQVLVFSASSSSSLVDCHI